MKLILSNGSSARGAQMGRRNILPEDVNKPIKLRMERLKWVDGDYDQFGAYWGGGNSRMGNNIYCAFVPIMSEGVTLKASNPKDNGPFKFYSGKNQVEVFVRASDRQTAKEKVKQSIPGATFFR